MPPNPFSLKVNRRPIIAQEIDLLRCGDAGHSSELAINPTRG
jgi:hypothetical protein